MDPATMKDQSKGGKKEKSETFGPAQRGEGNKNGHHTESSGLIGEQGGAYDQSEGQFRQFAEGMQKKHRLAECENQSQHRPAQSLPRRQSPGDQADGDRQREAGRSGGKQATEFRGDGI